MLSIEIKGCGYLPPTFKQTLRSTFEISREILIFFTLQPYASFVQNDARKQLVQKK